MRVDLECVRQGQVCDNAGAFDSYVETMAKAEERWATRRGISVIYGSVTCVGCTEDRSIDGTNCTAELNRPDFVVISETPTAPASTEVPAS